MVLTANCINYSTIAGVVLTCMSNELVESIIFINAEGIFLVLRI